MSAQAGRTNSRVFNQRRRRRGMALIVVISVFVVTMSVTGLWAKRIAMQRRYQRLREARVQTRWLAAAGFDRATAALRNDPQYAGETWRVDGPLLRPQDGADVMITVEPARDATPAQIVVQASYPSGPDPQVRYTRTIAARSKQLSSE